MIDHQCVPQEGVVAAEQPHGLKTNLPLDQFERVSNDRPLICPAGVPPDLLIDDLGERQSAHPF